MAFYANTFGWLIFQAAIFSCCLPRAVASRRDDEDVIISG